MLTRVQNNKISQNLLVEIQNDTTTLDNSFRVSQKFKTNLMTLSFTSK